MIGPSGIPTPTAVTITAIALLRSRSSGNRTAKTASVIGKIAAAPTPITARAPMTSPESSAAAASTDTAPNSARAISSSRLRPYRSPRTPAGSSRPANTST